MGNHGSTLFNVAQSTGTCKERFTTVGSGYLPERPVEVKIRHTDFVG